MNAQGVEAVIIEDLVKIGEDIGMEKGIEVGLRAGITALCRVLDVPLDAGRLAMLEVMDAKELQSLMGRLQMHRTW